MRYVIIGAGAIGAGVGGLVHQAGADVVLVARGDHLAAMREHGLRLLTPDGSSHTRPPTASGPDDVSLSTSDVLVLATKTQQAEAALATWADAPVHEDGEVVGTAGERLPILLALNGVAAEPMALRWFARVIGICVWMPAVLVTPGEVVVRCGPTRAILHMGRYPASLSDGADTRLLETVRADFAPGAVDVRIHDDVMPWKYRKLLGNLGNAIHALLGEDGGGDDVTEAARQEARTIFEAIGIELNDPRSEDEARDLLTSRPVPGAPEHMGGSTWQSLARGAGTVETDYLNGEIVALAHRIGRGAPVNSALTRLMRRSARDGASPGDLGADDLRAQVLLSGS